MGSTLRLWHPSVVSASAAGVYDIVVLREHDDGTWEQT